MKILMVCLGNICRSPLAEGIMKQKIREHGLNWSVDSAGTSSWHIGSPPDPRSIRVAAENGIDISKQRARALVAKDLDSFDLIFAMDSSNYSNIAKLSSADQMKKVKLILNCLHPGMNVKVPDPYYEDNFEEVYELLEHACEKFISSVEKP